MKVQFYFCALIIFIYSIVIYGGTLDKQGALNCSVKKMNSPFSLNSNLASSNQHSYDILDYNLNLNIYSCFKTPYPTTFSGTEIITLLADSSINSIQLNAINFALQVDSIRLSGTGFTHANDLLTITLDRTYAPGETLFVKIYYMHKSGLDGAFYVQSGMLFTDSEPEGARKWFPCWDKPSDKATLNLTAKVPGSVKLGSNGRLNDSTKSGDTIWYNWISRDPIATYLMVMSGKVNYNLDLKYWHKISNPLDSIPFRFYWNTGETGLAALETKVIQMCQQFSTLWGEYPFEKGGFATLNSQFQENGMENQTLISLGPNMWTEDLVCHEFAHQWFGDMITCGTWADIWLNEGFATFCECIWYEYTGGHSSYLSGIQNYATNYLANNPGWAISNPDLAVNTPASSTLYNTYITYYKGACVLHQLRYVMGDSLFFLGMHNYGTSSFRYNSATITDFKNIMTAAYGQDLSWFFNEWIYQPNHPVYANDYWFSSLGANKWQAVFQAIETQTNTVFFKMPLQIKISFTDGSDSTITVMNDVNNQTFIFNFSKQPVSLLFDPNSNIVLKQGTTTVTTPLPVELSSFTASAKENIVTLNWKTTTEVMNNGFGIERAKDNANSSGPDIPEFENIGFVKGGGSSNTIKEYSFIDHILSYGKYIYRLKLIDINGDYKFSPDIELLAGDYLSSYILRQNYPNPFNPSTKIRFEVPKTSRIQLIVYNLTGKVVKVLVDGNLEAGLYDKTFDAAGLASGFYFYELKSESTLLRQKMILLK